METNRADACEVQVKGVWVPVSLDEALNRLDASRTKRCVECHGQVRAHRRGDNGMAAHFEHLERHEGCSFGASFNGVKTPHRRSLI